MGSRRFGGRHLGGVLTAVACLVALIAAPVGADAAAGADDPSPGAPGIGDPYYPDYGNGGYQVSHYDLRLRYQPRNDHLRGTATLTGTATRDLSRFDLDFALTTDSVLVDNRPALFHRSGDHELVVTPARPIDEGAHITIVVTYHGVPSTVTAEGFTSWMRTGDGAVAANEPEVAWWWYPSNDHPLDKASFDVAVAVPDGYQAVSNGTLQRTGSRLGWTTWQWREREPMATYLAVLAVGHYQLHTDTTVDGRPIVTAYDTGLGENMGAARASVGRTGEIVRWESAHFGPYPFGALGGIVPNYDTGFALEDQTRPMYGRGFFDDGSNPYVVVHENAHQWFGDSVSVHHWSDIWLNEGFAGYAEWMWSEHTGEGSAAAVARYTYDQHPADDGLWQVKPGDPGAAHQFSDAVYDRGAMALQALRNVVGDQTFFHILRTWARSKRGGNGTIGQFAALAERLSGKDLTGLFHVWLFTTGKPPASAFHWPTAARAAIPVARPDSYRQIRRTNRLLSGR